MPDIILVSRSAAETLALGERIGKAARAGDVIALFGGLGAGKTVLTKGVIRGLGGDPDQVTSPTFVLMVKHEARIPLYHFDAYRLEAAGEIFNIGAEEAFYGDGVSVIEWADRVAEALPPDRVDAHLSVTSETERRLSFAPTGPQSEALIRRAAMVTLPAP